MTAPPKRIQRKRTKGWRMPKGTIYVGRPTKWGNYLSPSNFTILGQMVTGSFPNSRRATVQECVDRYRQDILDGEVWAPSHAAIREELRGKDLACWCSLSQPCHADVLLELANQ